MSDLSDEFDLAAKKVGMMSNEGEDAIEAASEYTDDLDKACPPLQHINSEAPRYVMKLLRRSYREMAGTVFETPEAAREITRENVLPKVIPAYGYYFALGVRLGEQDITDHQTVHAMAHETVNDIRVLAVLWMLDSDVIERVTTYLNVAFNAFTEKALFDQMPIELARSKIWDVWWMYSKIIVQQMFCLGWEIGKNRRMLRELAAIAEVSGGLDVPE